MSRFVKDWLRSLNTEVEHWHIGITYTTVDCFRHLALRVEIQPAVFLRQLASALQIHKASSDYAARWHDLASKAAKLHEKICRFSSVVGHECFCTYHTAHSATMELTSVKRHACTLCPIDGLQSHPSLRLQQRCQRY